MRRVVEMEEAWREGEEREEEEGGGDEKRREK